MTEMRRPSRTVPKPATLDELRDSGHGIVFRALSHRGRRKPTIAHSEHAREHLRRLRAERRGR
jgi:hypothetical protein